MDRTIYISYIAKTKALISFAVTAKCWFSHDAAQMLIFQQKGNGIEDVLVFKEVGKADVQSNTVLNFLSSLFSEAL